jgi:hypothetical protein
MVRTAPLWRRLGRSLADLLEKIICAAVRFPTPLASVVFPVSIVRAEFFQQPASADSIAPSDLAVRSFVCRSYQRYSGSSHPNRSHCDRIGALPSARRPALLLTSHQAADDGTP